MDWTKLAETFGVAAACLAGLSFAVWRVLLWLSHRIDRYAEPVFQRHLQFLDDVTASSQKHSRMQEASAQQHALILSHDEKIIALQEQIALQNKEMLRQNHELIELLREQLNK